MQRRPHKDKDIDQAANAFTAEETSMIALCKAYSPPKLCLVAVLLLATIPGCSTDAPPIGSAHGKITYNSEPVVEGNVVFENRSIGCLRAGALNADGSYTIDDLDVGEYKVSIHPPEPELPNENTIASGGRINVAPVAIPDPENIPKQFRLTENTPLVAKVAAGDNNQFDFDLATATQ